jgi:flagellar M-ring protein FliF
MQDNSNSQSSVTENERDYLPNEKITSRSTPPGKIKYESSSISVSAITYNVVREEDAKDQGLLDGITWNEYKLANAARVPQTVNQDLVNVVAKATGIAPENIAMVAYTEPLFIDAEGMNITASDIIQIVLILVILGMLGFVVFRSMRGEAGEEEEPELSVEDLLQSTQESELTGIELEEKSETRKLVEKFVEENPEAAANLLRNWLQEDWG